MKVTGGCHCGYISYEAEIDTDKVRVCHCTDCQTLSGSAFRFNATTRPGTFKLVSGEPKIYVKTAESGAKRQQSFCPECGTPIYAKAADADAHSLRVGSIHQRQELAPGIQIWARSELAWVAGLNSVPRVDKQQ